MLPFVLFLLASANRVQLVDEPFDIPAHEWRYDSELGLHQRAATLLAEYQVESGGPVRLLLLTREDREQMDEGKPHTALVESAPGASGHVRCDVPQPGEYALVVDNRANGTPARVRLSVWLDFPPVRSLSPSRQLTVILLSFAFFFGVVGWSAHKLWRGIER